MSYKTAPALSRADIAKAGTFRYSGKGFLVMRTSLEQDPNRNPEIWRSACKWLRENNLLTEHQFKQWIDPIDCLATEPEGDSQLDVHLETPNDFSADWVKDHYISRIENALAQVTGKKCKIRFSIKKSETALGNLPKNPLETRPAEVKRPQITSGSSDFHPTIRSIDPRFTFETFVVGASNQFAYASAVAVAERPAHQYNPLFLYGPPGLGKTHILHAIGNHVKEKNSNARVAYISAEGFVNDLIDSLQHQKMPKFRMKYRNSFDVLLIDDIQFIAGKKQTEEEFFHTFNALYSSKRQLVLTSDRPPKEIEKLEERIRTRFEWGLVADIQPPEIETRIAILKSKAERDDIYLPDDVATFLATYIKTNVRELEGILIRLQAQASLTGAEISLEMAKQELKLSAPEENSQITVENIQTAVCKYFQIKASELKSTSRAKKFSDPRQVSMYLIRKYTGLGYKEIGQYFGGRDHTTVLHAYEKIRKEIDAGKRLGDVVEAVQNML